jgi:hypothetical protein
MLSTVMRHLLAISLRSGEDVDNDLVLDTEVERRWTPALRKYRTLASLQNYQEGMEQSNLDALSIYVTSRPQTKHSLVPWAG